MTPKNYNLFLDDERVPSQVTWVQLPDVEWTIIRNYDDFVKIIEENGLPNLVSFDHDLSDEHYKEYFRLRKIDNQDQIAYTTFKEKTGFECAKWLANYCVDKKLPIPQYYIHTLNGIGGNNIYSILESARSALTST